MKLETLIANRTANIISLPILHQLATACGQGTDEIVSRRSVLTELQGQSDDIHKTSSNLCTNNSEKQRQIPLLSQCSYTVVIYTHWAVRWTPKRTPRDQFLLILLRLLKRLKRFLLLLSSGAGDNEVNARLIGLTLAEPVPLEHLQHQTLV